ncbi:MAG: YfhO family protein, partial [Chloroflexi bacterium]|nr:YfhO family protein [Chloroflexota bacterium]
MPIRGLKRDLAAIAVLAALALLFFWPVTMGGRTMLPVDSVYAWEPWRSTAGAEGVGVAHNSLVLDLYLQNYAWKSFIVDCLRAGELPLWNPYILSGVPFLAGGQHSAMYPLSTVFYVLPLEAAYGWFAALHVFLAGAFTYILARTLRVSRAGSLIAGAAFSFGGFMVIRNVFPMIVAAAVWLPLILAVVEVTVRRAEEGAPSPMGAIPLLAVGAAALGMVLLAGHPEMYYYVALTTAAYSLWRLAGLWRRRRSWRRSALVAAGLLGMGVVGLGLGAAQWVPLLDLVRHNFREGSASFAEVLGWAYPPRRAISLLIPDFFGNPAHHSYLDLFTWQRVDVSVNALGDRIDTIYWGIKNYVEGAAYVGILPLLLAAVAVLRRQGRRWGFFALLAALSLAFVFGSRLYWLVFRLPGLNQVHSPFRWVYLYTLSVAMLAGMGADA